MILGSLLACGPYAAWPEQEQVFPWVVGDEQLEPYETARWEEGTWDPSDPTRAGQYVQKAFNHRKGAPAETLAHFALQRGMLPALADGWVAGFTGDVMYMDQDRWSTYAVGAAPLLEHADLRLGNLETPTSPLHSIEPRALGLYAFNAPAAMLDSLPLDVLQLNNNHSLDTGDEGLSATIEAVVTRGMTPAGIDAPPVLDIAGESVIVLAYTWGLNDNRASDRYDLHVVPFGSLAPVPLAGMLDDIAMARAEHDRVIVMLHWGYEYEYYPDARFLRMARQIVAAGADVVAGQGPHVVQPAELCYVNHPEIVPGVGTCSVRDEGEPRMAAVFYSLGDFGSEVITLPARVGVVGSVSFGAEGVSGMGWQGVATTFADGPSIVPLDGVDAPEYQAEAGRLMRHLGDGWRR